MFRPLELKVAQGEAGAAPTALISMRLTAIVYGGDGTNLFEFKTLDGQTRHRSPPAHMST